MVCAKTDVHVRIIKHDLQSVIQERKAKNITKKKKGSEI